MKTSKNWHQIKDFTVQVSQLGFAFFSNNFFFQIANKAVQQLTSAGIMQWMINKQVGLKLKFETQKDPTKLTVESLSFGFVIWLGCCGICVATFVCEFCFCVKLKRNFENLIKIMKNRPTRKVKLRKMYYKRNYKTNVFKPQKVQKKLFCKSQQQKLFVASL